MKYIKTDIDTVPTRENVQQLVTEGKAESINSREALYPTYGKAHYVLKTDYVLLIKNPKT